MPPLLDKAHKHHKKGKRKQAIALCRKAVARTPGSAEATRLLGVLLRETGDLAGAEAMLRKALELAPNDPLCLQSMGELELTLGDLAAACGHLEAAARLDPGSAEPLLALANVNRLAGKLDDAQRYCDRARAAAPESPNAMNAQALLYLEQDRPEEARDLLLHAAERADSAVLPTILVSLSRALMACGQLDEAKDAAKKAVRLAPGDWTTVECYADVLARQSDWREALAMLNKLATLVPNDPQTLYSIAYVQDQLGSISRAVSQLRALLSSFPAYVPAHMSLGTSLVLSGSLEQGIACYERAAGLAPPNLLAHSNILLAMHYRKYLEPQELFEAHQAVGALLKQISPQRPQFDLTRRPPQADAKLTIGFISPDFRVHSVAYLALPVLEQLDRDAFAVKCFATDLTQDEMTERLRAQADGWHSVSDLDDGAAAALIAKEDVDILVDLAGHTAGNRIGIFGHKPAPLQITWLGYPNTTGLSCIQVRLTDAFADPVGETDRFHTEELVRLSPCFFCYSPPDDCPEAVHETQERIRFVSYNAFPKMNTAVLDVWARILDRVPDAVLQLKNRSLCDSRIRADVQRLFRRHGRKIAKRVELLDYTESTRSHLDHYRTADIALDTFPYSGTVTTLEALWMGVPVVTLVDQVHASRVSGSILTTLGLGQLVTTSVDDYIAAAVTLAEDGQQLQALQSGLRTRMEQSPLLDAEGFTRRLEQTLQALWKRFGR